MRILYFSALSSTQKFARSHLFNEDTLIKAKRQTDGIGQRGKTWIDATGNFSGTFVFKDQVRYTKHVGHFSLIIAYGCALYFESLGFYDFSFKWPNDIYNKPMTKKMGGILCELNADDLLVGIGLNLYHTPLPIFTTFHDEGASLHAFLSRNFFMTLKNVLNQCQEKGFDFIRGEWLKRCGHKDKYVEFSDDHFGIFKDLTPAGIPIFW
ncbi:MAG: Bifunctional ligase/repressor BirA [Holosporales bacterium]